MIENIQLKLVQGQGVFILLLQQTLTGRVISFQEESSGALAPVRTFRISARMGATAV